MQVCKVYNDIARAIKSFTLRVYGHKILAFPKISGKNILVPGNSLSRTFPEFPGILETA